MILATLVPSEIVWTVWSHRKGRHMQIIEIRKQTRTEEKDDRRVRIQRCVVKLIAALGTTVGAKQHSLDNSRLSNGIAVTSDVKRDRMLARLVWNQGLTKMSLEALNQPVCWLISTKSKTALTVVPIIHVSRVAGKYFYTSVDRFLILHLVYGVLLEHKQQK